jgi:hypothetical protein
MEEAVRRTVARQASWALAALAVAALTALVGAATASAASAPSIESESVSNITPTDTTLEAQINPNGLETEYQFRVLASPCHANPVNCELLSDPLYPSPADEIAAASGTQTVSVELNGAGLTLEPGREYHYAVFATNSAGTASGPDQTFTTPSASPPSIEGESASNITPTDATLEAQVNPQSSERGTRYQFQVVANASEYPAEFACPTEGFPAGTSLCLGLTSQSGALPIRVTPAGTQDQAVGLDLASTGMTLQPGTTYHYRVIAARTVQTVDTIRWEDPIVYGPDQTFTTPPATAPPSIDGELASGITEHDATLEAQINTEGLATSYQFRLESGCLPPLACLAIAVYPLPSGELLGSFVGQSVSLDLNSTGVTLHPSIKYRYSVEATSAAGTAYGADQTFTTPSEPSAANTQTSGTGGQLPAIQSPPSASLSHRRRHRHHRKHKRELQSNKLRLAKRAR